MKEFNILSLFDGMSGGRIALERAGIPITTYYTSEIDKYALEIAKKNYPDNVELGDIVNLNSNNLPRIDLLIGGSPCQDLSGLKLGLGLEGPKSKLLLEFIRIKEELSPKYFLLENVVPRKKEWKETIDELMGVEGYLINSDLFVQQNRPRIYWTNIPINKLPSRPNWVGRYYQYRRRYYREKYEWRMSLFNCKYGNRWTQCTTT